MVHACSIYRMKKLDLKWNKTVLNYRSGDAMNLIISVVTQLS